MVRSVPKESIKVIAYTFVLIFELKPLFFGGGEN
jgi:hypothetical protein